jgi:hypothetical protein
MREAAGGGGGGEWPERGVRRQATGHLVDADEHAPRAAVAIPRGQRGADGSLGRRRQHRPHRRKRRDEVLLEHGARRFRRHPLERAGFVSKKFI